MPKITQLRNGRLGRERTSQRKGELKSILKQKRGASRYIVEKRKRWTV